MRLTRTPPFAFALAAACLAVPLSAVAQMQDDQPAGATDNSVYVRDSGVAAEKLALAERLERQKEWDKSADVYMEVAQKFADRVVPSRRDAAGKPTQYVSAARQVQDKLAAWPAEGLAAYRRRYEDAARDLLNNDDPAAAARVADLYFLTDAGRDAALKLMGDAFERGDLAAAAAVGTRLLDTHPGLLADRPGVLLRTGVAEHLAGRDDAAHARLAELQTKFADALVPAGGADAKAAAVLADAITRPAEVATFRGEDWPTAFGTPDASAVPRLVSAGGARMFGVDLSVATVRGPNNNPGLKSVRDLIARDRELGLNTGVLPSVDGGALFFQDNTRVYALNLASGAPLPGWAATYPGTGRGAFTVDAAPTPRGKQLAVSVTAGGVVALVGQVDPNAANFGYAPNAPRVVSLDRATGRLRWSATPAKLKFPDDAAALREGVFYGTPVVDDDTVYALLSATRGGQFDECYVVAMRLSDGAYKWSTYVASTSLGNRMYDGGDDGSQITGTPASVSLSSGRLYVLTNLGALACLDAGQGHVRWLNLYNRKPTSAARLNVFASRMPKAKPYLVMPPVVADGRVFVMPADATTLVVCDAADGTVVRELPAKLDPSSKLQPASVVLGVVGDSLLLASSSTVYKVPWQTFDPGKSLVENGGMYKNIPPGKNDKQPNDSIRGRPFVSADAVLVPSSDKLYRVSLRSFKTESEYPNQGDWPEDESTGNVLATPENLIVAGPQRLTVYADLAAATAKLDARIAAAPDDYEPYARYAELLFAANQPKAALDRLDEAAARLGGIKDLTPGPGRDRLFDIAATAAAKLPRSGTDAAVVDAVFDRAAAAARTAPQQVRYRTARAAAYRAAGNGPAEMALQQEILSNADWRDVTTAGKPGANTAGDVAEAAVTELAKQYGEPIYAEYDAAAAARLGALRQADPLDVDAVLAVADDYPIAKAAPEALTIAADAYEAAGQTRQATQTLRRLLRRDLSNERRQVALQALARNSLKSPGQVAIARVRLRQARLLAPTAQLVKPLLLPDGKPLEGKTVAEAADALDAVASRIQGDTLAALNVPGGNDVPYRPPFKPAVEVAAASRLIEQQADVARTDRVLVWGTDRRVGVARSDSGTVAWTDADTADAPLGGGYAGDTLVVVAAGEATGVDASGKRLWRVPVPNLPAVELTGEAGGPVARDPTDPPQVNVGQLGGPLGGGQRVVINGRVVIVPRRFNGGRFPVPVQIDNADSDAAAAPNSPEHFTKYRLLSDRVVLATSTGRVVALDAARGTVLWQNRMSESPATRLLSNDDFVAAGYIDPNNTSSAYVFDAMTGRVVFGKTYDGSNDPQQAGGLVNLALSPDGVLVTMQAARLTGVDLYAPPGTSEWKYVASAPQPGRVMMPFVGSPGDDQLVITADRVLAVNTAPGEQPSVRVFDLRTLKAMTVKDPRTNRDAEAQFGLAVGNADTKPLSVLAAGSAFYVVGQKSIAAFDLNNPEADWVTLSGAGDRKPTRDAVVTRDHVLMIAPASASPADADRLPDLMVSMYSRTPVKGSNGLMKESGMLDQRPVLKDPAGFVGNAWQAADGAFFYVSGDNKLKRCAANR